MKRTLYVLLVSLLFVACSSSDVPEEKSEHESYEATIKALNERILELENQEETLNPWDLELKILSGNEDKLRYVIGRKETSYDVINVIGFDLEEVSRELYESDQIQMKGFGSKEWVKVNIYGSVIDFELCSIEYGDDLEISQLVVIDNLDLLRNTEVMIETTLPEGLPAELIRWKDDKGNVYQEVLHYDGLGISGSIVLPKE